jgi:hypothetical protein
MMMKPFLFLKKAASKDRRDTLDFSALAELIADLATMTRKDGTIVGLLLKGIPPVMTV